MKKLLLVLFLIPQTFLAQELPINFSQSIHQFSTKGSGEFNLITDPNDSTNMVAEIISSTGFNIPYFETFELILARFIDVSDSVNNSISFDYYSTVAGARSVTLKLDDEQYGDLPVFVSFSTSGVIGWETITVDFDDASYEYPHHNNTVALKNYGKLIIKLSNGNPPVESTCYIDNIIGAKNGTPYNIFEGDAILTTQQEVNDFGAISYSKIIGSLKIASNTEGVTSDISDLTPLSTIHSIGKRSGFNSGILEITDNNNLQNLDGLNNLRTKYGSLIIKNNSSLSSISSLSKLNYFGAFSGYLIIENNNSLTSLNGLHNATFREIDLNILSNDSLLSISNLSLGSGDIIIEDNPSLKTISNIEFADKSGVGIFSLKNNVNLSEITNISSGAVINNQFIIDNTGLTNLQIFENFKVLQFFFKIVEVYLKNNDHLISLDGLFSNLNDVLTVELDNNSQLSNINLLSLFTSGSLRIANSPKITSLSPLANFKGAYLEIEGINGFTNLNGLEGIAQLSFLDIINTNLTDISQLGMSNYSGGIRIEGNQGITDLSVFSPMEKIGGCSGCYFWVLNNNKLTSLDGFENVNEVSVPDFKIEDNNLLNNYCAFSNLFSTGTFSGDYSVRNNKYNPTRTEIGDETSCSVLSVEDFNSNSISFSPNPTTDYIYIDSKNKMIKIEIYNVQGQKVNTTFSEDSIDVRSISNGIYFLKIKTEKGDTTFKIIKQ